MYYSGLCRMFNIANGVHKTSSTCTEARGLYGSDLTEVDQNTLPFKSEGTTCYDAFLFCALFLNK